MRSVLAWMVLDEHSTTREETNDSPGGLYDRTTTASVAGHFLSASILLVLPADRSTFLGSQSGTLLWVGGSWRTACLIAKGDLLYCLCGRNDLSFHVPRLRDAWSGFSPASVCISKLDEHSLRNSGHET
jgi:hypothetical protein